MKAWYTVVNKLFPKPVQNTTKKQTRELTATKKMSDSSSTQQDSKASAAGPPKLPYFHRKLSQEETDLIGRIKDSY